MNPLKHVLLAKQSLVRGPKFNESPREFREFCPEFYANLAPVGALELQPDRALNQLERLQRRRQGEPVPPPVTMEISAGS